MILAYIIVSIYYLQNDPSLYNSQHLLSPNDPSLYSGQHLLSPNDPSLYNSQHLLSPNDPSLYSGQHLLSPNDPSLYNSQHLLSPNDPSLYSDQHLLSANIFKCYLAGFSSTLHFKALQSTTDDCLVFGFISKDKSPLIKQFLTVYESGGLLWSIGRNPPHVKEVAAVSEISRFLWRGVAKPHATWL